MIENFKKWNATIYLRISKEDKEHDESNSIKNQRELILEYVKNQPDLQVVDIKTDDGFSGVNFERNAFKQMIKNIEKHETDCVIVKDLSRLGRNHIEVGKYIERYFSSKNVRFIAINDNYDSNTSDMNDINNSLIIPFKNILNEAFLEDISNKTKTQLEVKRRKGEFIGAFAVYGYLKQGKKLVIDQYAANIVRNIFDDKINALNEKQIADKLNKNGVLSPLQYKRFLGLNYKSPFANENESRWSVNTIKRILKNRVYIGFLEQGKRSKVNYRFNKIINKPQNEWVIIEKAHEPIISESCFYLVQELLLKDTRVSAKLNKLHLFSGFLHCSHCGQPMVVKTINKNKKSYVYYICSTHHKFGTCINNNISSAKLEEFVLVSLKNHMSALIAFDKIENSLSDIYIEKRKNRAIDEMFSKALQDIQKYKTYLIKSYEDYVNQLISKEEYILFKNNFNNQILSAENNIKSLQSEKSKIVNSGSIKELIERYKDITALERGIIVNLIETLSYGDKNLEIVFRYKNEFEDSILEHNHYSEAVR